MLLYGDKYNHEDVNRIVEATNCQTKYNYILYTDNPGMDNLHPQIETVKIDSDWGTFNKIKMFERDNVGECVYLDLDIIIQYPNIDILFHKGVQKPAICKTYWKHEGFEAEHDGGDFNSSVMSWNSSNAKHIYEHFMKNPDYFITKYKGCDDKYLFHEHKDNFSNYGRGKIYSYMYGIDHKTDVSPRAKKYHEFASICLLNGQENYDFDLRSDYYFNLSNNKVG